MITEAQSISIHALLAESDFDRHIMLFAVIAFLSTLSLRRATIRPYRLHLSTKYFYPRSPCGERRSANCSYHSARPISIHALLAESDRGGGFTYHFMLNFYPRSPCGERQFKMPVPAWIYSFLSTLSLRRATNARLETRQPCAISIHALLAESDRINRNIANSERKFLSTLSLRRATTT